MMCSQVNQPGTSKRANALIHNALMHTQSYMWFYAHTVICATLCNAVICATLCTCSHMWHFMHTQSCVPCGVAQENHLLPSHNQSSSKEPQNGISAFVPMQNTAQISKYICFSLTLHSHPNRKQSTKHLNCLVKELERSPIFFVQKTTPENNKPQMA